MGSSQICPTAAMDALFDRIYLYIQAKREALCREERITISNSRDAVDRIQILYVKRVMRPCSTKA